MEVRNSHLHVAQPASRRVFYFKLGRTGPAALIKVLKRFPVRSGPCIHSLGFLALPLFHFCILYEIFCMEQIFSELLGWLPHISPLSP
jgi:hypothetical protein